MNEGKERRNPDILETIADLSNDEVFTPPKLANDVLDMLPKELWSDSSVTFLDPTVKTGIFLRAITERLIEGLADEIPDLQERVNHILTKQVFGLGITELTTLMSRRSVYCSTTANGEYSVCTEFTDVEGNIKFPNSKHDFNKDGKCEVCGASKDNYDNIDGLDNYAYSFLHEDMKEVFGDMKFDVIIGNPPYQRNDGIEGANFYKATAIYHLFIDKAVELNPKYISMIVPSRYMTNTAEGISNEWTKTFITSNKIKVIHDYENSKDVFKNVMIRGGVNYFLWDKKYNGKCDYNFYSELGDKDEKNITLDTFNLGFVVRDLKAHSIINKVNEGNKNYYNKETQNFSHLVGPKHFFDKGKQLATDWRDYQSEKSNIHDIKFYVSEHTNNVPYGWIQKADVPKNKGAINIHKLYMSAGGGIPRYGEPGSACSETYLVIGYEHNLTKIETLNIMKYMSTRFFRFLMEIKQKARSATRGVYQLVPIQDWSKEWTDIDLYKKYKLTQDEIKHIEKTVNQMDISKELEIANSLPDPDEDSVNEVDSDDK